MGRKREKLTDQIRRAVDVSGYSRYRIWKETKISQATLSRFMSGEGGISLAHLDELADFLELNLAKGWERTAKDG